MRGVACLSILSLALVSGCLGTSPTPRFYALQPIQAERAPASDLAVAVGPLHLPRYLQNPQIVTRRGDSEVGYEQAHRWAGSLESQILRVVGENLSNLLGTERVIVYPLAGAFPVTYRVRLDVERFDGQMGVEVDLRVRWVVVDVASNDALAVEFTSLRFPLDSKRVADLVDAESRALGALSREIAARIRELASGE